jgi:Arc/MetJ-type ribon-helix-helix transcriptional regulator
MRTQITKRFNINLTKTENDALENLTEEYANRNWKANTSDIIRDAIVYYSEKMTDYKTEAEAISEEENLPF